MRDMIVVLGAQARSGRDAARQLRAANYYGRVLPAWADIETLAAEDASGIVLTEPLAEGERYRHAGRVGNGAPQRGGRAVRRGDGDGARALCAEGRGAPQRHCDGALFALRAV